MKSLTVKMNIRFNMAESINFAANRWVEYGKRFRDCVCLDEARDISINMAPFVRAVQPEKYKDYMEGRDFSLHPEDPWYIRWSLLIFVHRQCIVTQEVYGGRHHEVEEGGDQ